MWHKLNKCYPPTLELIPFLLLVLTVYLAFSNYSILPEKLPIDFDSRGVPEEWNSKNVVVFLYFGVGVFIYLLLTASNIWFAVTGDPKSLINLPKKWKAALNDVQTEKLRVILNRYLFILKILIQSMILYLLYSSIEIALERTGSIGTPMTLLVVAIFIIIALMVWKSFSISRTPHRNVTRGN
ncbi:DUF1648 domain-containing protein [Chloroflexota bacterium]